MKKKVFDTQFIRFLGVGVINTAVGTGTMFQLYNVFGAGYWISSASNYIVGSIASYILNKKFTFKNRKYQKSDKYYLVMMDMESGVEAQRHEFIIDIAFADDFGFGI